MQRAVPNDNKTTIQTSPIKFVVRLVDGGRFTVSASVGSRVIDAIRAYGLPLKAECDGRCFCASCHVRVSGEWAGRLVLPDAEEVTTLRKLHGAGRTSRLFCQLALTPDLDGLDFEIDPSSLVPQTHWVAG